MNHCGHKAMEICYCDFQSASITIAISGAFNVILIAITWKLFCEIKKKQSSGAAKLKKDKVERTMDENNVSGGSCGYTVAGRSKPGETNASNCSYTARHQISPEPWPLRQE